MAALYASAEGDLSELRRLLISGVSPNVADYDGRTLLHLAASEGHKDIVKYLVKHHHADVHAKDRWGGTPLTDAENGGHASVLRFLQYTAERMKIDRNQESLVDSDSISNK